MPSSSKLEARSSLRPLAPLLFPPHSIQHAISLLTYLLPFLPSFPLALPRPSSVFAAAGVVARSFAVGRSVGLALCQASPPFLDPYLRYRGRSLSLPLPPSLSLSLSGTIDSRKGSFQKQQLVRSFLPPTTSITRNPHMRAFEGAAAAARVTSIWPLPSIFRRQLRLSFSSRRPFSKLDAPISIVTAAWVGRVCGMTRASLRLEWKKGLKRMQLNSLLYVGCRGSLPF